MTDWHRLFGLLLTDFFTGSQFTVEIEKHLSLKKQFLDVVVLRKGPGDFDGPLPDGLDGLRTHNLITFKSHHEALDDWTLKEQTGHYVNYRKQVSPSMQDLLPEEEFRLYAVCSRFPQKLADAGALQRVQDGVYDCRRGTDVIRIIVVCELPRTENNALLHLLSASLEQIAYAIAHYQQRSQETSGYLDQLIQRYRQEGLTMSYTKEDFRRDYIAEHFAELTARERRELLRRLSPDERLQDLSIEERLQDLSTEELENCIMRRKAKSRKPKKKK